MISAAADPFITATLPIRPAGGVFVAAAGGGAALDPFPAGTPDAVAVGAAGLEDGATTAGAVTAGADVADPAAEGTPPGLSARTGEPEDVATNAATAAATTTRRLRILS
jgi:hypothetical protein